MKSNKNKALARGAGVPNGGNVSHYNVEFSGRLLAGFDPREVRLHAGARLRMSETQLDRVFDGRPIVLKKDVDAQTGQRYLGELHRLGMASRLIPLDAPGESPAETFKVVFNGQILPGFEADAVAVAAARRLSLGPLQVEKLFSGKKAVLKRGISERRGLRYVAELATLGMQTTLVGEDEAPGEPEATPPVPALDAEVPPALVTTQFEVPPHAHDGDDLPEPEHESIDHAATLLVDPARLVEQMNYAPPPIPAAPVAPLPRKAIEAPAEAAGPASMTLSLEPLALAPVETPPVVEYVAEGLKAPADAVAEAMAPPVEKRAAESSSLSESLDRVSLAAAHAAQRASSPAAHMPRQRMVKIAGGALLVLVFVWLMV